MARLVELWSKHKFVPGATKAGWLRVAGSNRISIGGETSLIPYESHQSEFVPIVEEGFIL